MSPPDRSTRATVLSRLRSVFGSRAAGATSTAAAASSSRAGSSSTDDRETHISSDNQLTVGSQPGQSAGAPRHSFEVGGLAGPYRLHQRLGKGGMGEVFEAEHVETGRRVALKVLTRSLDNPEAAARFLREGRLAAKVSHPNSVYVYASHEVDGVPMIAMELVPGGTLQESVDANGPMDPVRAVDAILQVVAGLDAANDTGVLHRDVKPSNCFITPAGMVKVGDYGLSMSTMAVGQSTQLTMQGTFLGTPAFASPEQVSGSEVDARSDIYAVGATLYFLLTGRTPFNQATVMQVFAAVLREDPASPRTHVPTIPEPLAAIVLRCLRKDPAARYATYAELRQALGPFSSKIAEAAPIRMRVLSWLIDSAVLMPIGVMAGVEGFRAVWRAGAGRAVDKPAVASLWSSLIVASVALAYYGWCEGRWGAGIGKRVCGLRVVGPDRLAPGLWRGALRAAAFVAIPNLATMVLYARFGARPSIEVSQVAWFAPLQMLLFAGMWVRARKRTGYRGLHEWASGTRVIRLAKLVRQARPPAVRIAAETPLAVGSAGLATKRSGAYVCDAVLWSGDGEELVAAHDDALRRPVWIHRVRPGTPPLAVTRQNLARRTRLRVLATVRTEADSYDVYEAAQGGPLTSPQPWSVVRQWLLGLSSELGDAIGDGTMPASVAPSQVWVTAAGGVRLLDFAAPPVASTGAVAIHDFASAQAFLGALADHARGGSQDQSRRASWPLSALKVLDGLRRQAFTSTDDLRAAVEQASTPIESVSRGRRLASFALPGVVPTMVLVVVAAVGYLNARIRMDPQLDALDVIMERVVQLDGQKTPRVDLRQREALRIHVGDRFGQRIAGLGWLDIDPIEKAAAQRARQVALAASSAERERAAIDAQPLLAEINRKAAARPAYWPDLALSFSSGECFALAFQGIFAIVFALFLRGPVGLWLIGLTIATRDGAPATRLRAMWRSVIGWSPAIVAIATTLIVRRLFGPVPHLAGVAGAVGLLVFLAGLAWTIAVPDRSPQDRLAGTVVVPL